MRRFRYDGDGTWFKGNTHIHSTASDGGWTFDELAAAYGAAGYDFLFRTDHWVTSRVAADGAPGGTSLLWLDGVELDGFDEQNSYYHVVCLGALEGITREMGFSAALQTARDQGGLLILAHPLWTGNTCDEATRWDFHGVEIYNHVCRWLNGKGDGRAHWELMLRGSPETLAFASDDAHTSTSHPGWNGGWVVVQAPTLSSSAILEALRAGRFYSSTGPAFKTIAYDGTSVTIETSPVQFARLVGPGSRGLRQGNFDGALFERVSFEVPEEWPYVYLEIEDDCGRRAWTNTLFADPSQGEPA